ncbi:hypothetical protein WR25_22314 [Diploscapter pachys]|uniref:CoA carboxyltransferase N-terminal domain-containing protein n=1 Tax=Diploscapter pachys TaxID=2018661 RepID=A0A2A2M3M3_9BILA|nr:hypothetical protein WR25_22314 [Diploscapter pachys]
MRSPDAVGALESFGIGARAGQIGGEAFGEAIERVDVIATALEPVAHLFPRQGHGQAAAGIDAVVEHAQLLLRALERGMQRRHPSCEQGLLAHAAAHRILVELCGGYGRVGPGRQCGDQRRRFLLRRDVDPVERKGARQRRQDAAGDRPVTTFDLRQVTGRNAEALAERRLAERQPRAQRAHPIAGEQTGAGRLGDREKQPRRSLPMSSTLNELERRRAAARAGGGEKRVAAQHAKGKLTARERLDILLDEGSFEEIDM